MPETTDRHTADRASGLRTNMHSRANGEMILIPDDLFEGKGNFIDVDNQGNPVGWRLGRPEERDGRRIYIGTSRTHMYRQTRVPLGPRRPSHVVDYSLVKSGQLPPTQDTPLLAPLPRPPKPEVIKIQATSLGYPASTASSPYWYAWALYHNKSGKMTGYSPAVPFQLANGQSFEVVLPEDIPRGYSAALILSEPGTSRPEAPGAMYVQRVIDPTQYFLPTYPLSGPYRRDQPATRYNQTRLSTYSGNVSAKKTNDRVGAKVASYACHITFTDESGETVLSSSSDTVTIKMDDDFSYKTKDDAGGEDVVAGRGKVKIYRPSNVPPTATGWRARVYIKPLNDGPQFSPGWYRVVDRRTGQGGESPISLKTGSVECSGWSGDEEPYGISQRVIMEADEPPRSNSTGIDAPDERPETPNAVSTGRPAPDETYYICVTDTLRGLESLPSEPQVISDLASSEVMAIMLVDPSDLIPNSSFVETNNQSLPMYWTINQSGGVAQVVGDELVLETTSSAAAATTTPSATSPRTTVDPTQFAVFEVELAIDDPKSGAAAGAVSCAVRQINAAGAITQTTTVSRSDVGDHAFEITIHPNGDTTVGATTFRADTVAIEVVYFFASVSSSNKNRRVRLKHCKKRSHRHRRRHHRRKKENPPNVPTVPPGTIIQYPPEIPTDIPPATTVPDPDRPSSTGTPFHTETFEAGLAGIAGPFGQVINGSATLATEAAASLGPAGTLGLTCKKTTAGTQSRAYLSGGFPAPASEKDGTRHCLAMYNRYRISNFTGSGTLVLRALVANDASQRTFAQIDATQTAQKDTLTITNNATLPGTTPSVSLNGVSYPVTVSGVKQVNTLDLSSGPTSYGSVQLEMDTGIKTTYTPGGTKHAWDLRFTSDCDATRYLEIYLNGETFWRKIYDGDTAATVADRIAAGDYTGWTTERLPNYTVRFTAATPGPRPGYYGWYEGNSSTRPVGTNVATGTLSTIAEFAQLIASAPPAGWTAAVDGVDNTIVRFTATVPKLYPAPLLYPEATGVAGTFSATTPGSVDSKEQVAAKFRALTPPGYVVSGSDNTATFTASTIGPRPATTYNPATSGASGTVTQVEKGATADLVMWVRDSLGVWRSRTIVRNYTPAQIMHLDLAVSGAKTDRAVVTAWYGDNTTTLTQVGRMEDVDLTGLDAYRHRVGVVAESSPALTWEVHVDDIKVTPRGLKYFRDHDTEGNWLGQVVGYYDPTMPISQDRLLQDGSIGVFPGKSYVLSLYARAENPTATEAKLLVASARSTNNHLQVVATAGAIPAGANDPATGWVEYTTPSFIVPPNCYRLELNSRDIGGGHYVIQEVVSSEGDTPKRTHLYAPTGSYAQILDTTTRAGSTSYKFWREKRSRLAAPATVPTGTTMAILFASAPTKTGPFSPDQSDPALVPENPYIRVKFEAACTSTKDTPVILPNSPSVEWDLLVSSTKRMSTLLDSNRGQLPGGAAFRRILPWSKRNAAARMTLPSGKLYDDPSLFESVGFLPPSVLWLFSTDAVTWLHENWRQPFYIEAYGQLLYVLISGPPGEAEPQTTNGIDEADGNRKSIYEIALPYCEVLSATPLASSVTA